MLHSLDNASRIGGDGQSGHLPPRDMALVCLGAVDTGALEHAAFGAAVAIPLSETLEDVHGGVLPRGVLAHSDLCDLRLVGDLRRNIHLCGAGVMSPA